MRTFTSFSLACIIVLFTSVTLMGQDSVYSINAYPQIGLPGINSYLVVNAVNGNKKIDGFYPLNYSNNNIIVVYNDNLKKQVRSTYKTGNHITVCIALNDPAIMKDHTCIYLEVSPSRQPNTYPLVFNLNPQSNRENVKLQLSLEFAGLTPEEIQDHAFLKRHNLVGTFRVYYPYSQTLYQRSYGKILPAKYDFSTNAMPSELIDTKYNLETIETIFQHIKKRDSSASRYIPYLQAKLIYDLGLYETKLENGLPAETEKLKSLPDKLRNEILHYYEMELANKPNPLMQYHYAIYVAQDLERGKTLLGEVARNAQDKYLQQLAEFGLASLERREMKEKMP